VTDGVELRFWAAVHSIETGEEKRLATFYLLNTSVNLNNWRVTDKALEDALPTLLGKPLGCIPGYRINHIHETVQVGRFVKVDKPDGYALATAEITDLVAWGKISSGEWGPISVVILAFKVTCSVCGEDITPGPDEHILSGKGHEVVESFRFEKVDFVSEAAYPQASVITLGHLAEAQVPDGILLTAAAIPFEETVKAPEDRGWDADAAEARVRSWAGGPDKEKINWSKYRRAFAWYDRSAPEEFGSYKLPHHDIINGRLSVVWRGVAAAMQVLLGARGGVQIPESDHRGVYNHLARHYRQYEKTVPDYHASQSTSGRGPGSPGLDPKNRGRRKMSEERIAELEQKVETLQEQVETLTSENEQLKAAVDENPEEEDPKVKELRERIETMEAERHQEIVNDTIEARVKAGLVKDRQEEAERLEDLDDKTLILLAEDAGKVAEKLAKASSTGPKTKYTATSKSAFDEAVEETRERLFGHRKEAEN